MLTPRSRLARLCVTLPLILPLLAQKSPKEFQFSQPDEKLLEEANELDRQFEQKGLLYRDPTAQEYLDRIGKNLISGASPPDRVVYRFRILRDPMVNAFALPNGSIYVNTGLIAALENEAQLASVMGHEITHVAARHEYTLNRNIRKKTVTLEVIAAIAGAGGFVPAGAVFGITLTVASRVSEVFVVSTVYGYSRDLEREADIGGYGSLIHAGYDGAAMKRSLEILDEKLEFEPAQPFWRTHPKLQERIATAGELLKNENSNLPRAADPSDYLNHLAPVIRYNAILDLDSRRARTAVARVQRLVDWKPDDAVDRSLLADAYRSLGAKTVLPQESELSDRGKNQARHRALKLTEDEEQKVLLKSPSGASTLEANRAKAEALYREAIALDPALPDPHRGLGMLYQDEAKFAEAVRQYQSYLDLAPPQALDRLRIERRLEATKALEGAGK
jgi:beta-barrel assembly-enhancing protease